MFLGGGGSSDAAWALGRSRGLCPSCGGSSAQQHGSVLRGLLQGGMQDSTRSCGGCEQFLSLECHTGLMQQEFKGFCWGLGVCWPSVIKSTRSHCWRIDWTDFPGIRTQGKAEGHRDWENILGKHLCFLCPPWSGLMGRCWATSSFHLACQGYCRVFLCRKGYTKRTQRVDEGENKIYFRSIQINNKTPSHWFQ